METDEDFAIEVVSSASDVEKDLIEEAVDKEVAAAKEAVALEVQRQSRRSRVAEPWDTLVGGVQMDLSLNEHRTRANVVEMQLAVAHFSPSCKTLTKIREIPIPGAKFAPPPVRSQECPRGLPTLKKPALAWLASIHAARAT